MINFDLIFILLLIIQGRGTIRNKRVIFDALRQVIFWPRRAGLTGAAPARQWAASATCWCLGTASGRVTEYRRCQMCHSLPLCHPIGISYCSYLVHICPFSPRICPFSPRNYAPSFHPPDFAIFFT